MFEPADVGHEHDSRPRSRQCHRRTIRTKITPAWVKAVALQRDRLAALDKAFALFLLQPFRNRLAFNRKDFFCGLIKRIRRFARRQFAKFGSKLTDKRRQDVLDPLKGSHHQKQRACAFAPKNMVFECVPIDDASLVFSRNMAIASVATKRGDGIQNIVGGGA